MGGPTELRVQEALRILKGIKHPHLLGFSSETKPEDLIITSILVPPPQVRPSVDFGTGQRNQDDLTKIYRKIITMNAEIAKTTSEKDKLKLVDELTSVVFRMFDNQKDALEPLTIGDKKKKVKSIKERLSGKRG